MFLFRLNFLQKYILLSFLKIYRLYNFYLNADSSFPFDRNIRPGQCLLSYNIVWLIIEHYILNGPFLNVMFLNHVVVSSYQDRKSTRLNSSHVSISYAVFCLKKKRNIYSIMI